MIAEAAPPAPVPPFTAAHEALREAMAAFVAGELRPHAADWEAARTFPDAVFGCSRSAAGWA